MEKFQKNDLKPGMVVETANGTLLLVVSLHYDGYDDLRAISDTCWVDLGHYNRDLARYDFLKQKDPVDRDIIRVYEFKGQHSCGHELKKLLDKDNLKLLFDNTIKKEMTLEEIEKELGYKISVVNRKTD